MCWEDPLKKGKAIHSSILAWRIPWSIQLQRVGHNRASFTFILGFSGSSADKESACSVGDPSSIPKSGRSPGEGIGYSLQYSWASLMAQLVKNPPATWDTQVQFLGWEDPLEKGKATHSSISGLENSMDYTVYGVTKSQTRLSNFHFHFSISL